MEPLPPLVPVLLVFSISCVLCVRVHFVPPKAILQAGYPAGFRAFIPDFPGCKRFAFYAKLNAPFSGDDEAGRWGGEVLRPHDGYWTFEETKSVLHPGDVLHYWTLVLKGDTPYVRKNLTWTVPSVQKPNDSVDFPTPSTTAPSLKPTPMKVVDQEDVSTSHMNNEPTQESAPSDTEEIAATVQELPGNGPGHNQETSPPINTKPTTTSSISPETTVDQKASTETSISERNGDEATPDETTQATSSPITTSSNETTDGEPKTDSTSDIPSSTTPGPTQGNDTNLTNTGTSSEESTPITTPSLRMSSSPTDAVTTTVSANVTTSSPTTMHSNEITDKELATDGTSDIPSFTTPDTSRSNATTPIYASSEESTSVSAPSPTILSTPSDAVSTTDLGDVTTDVIMKNLDTRIKDATSSALTAGAPESSTPVELPSTIPPLIPEANKPQPLVKPKTTKPKKSTPPMSNPLWSDDVEEITTPAFEKPLASEFPEEPPLFPFPSLFPNAFKPPVPPTPPTPPGFDVCSNPWSLQEQPGESRAQRLEKQVARLQCELALTQRSTAQLGNTVQNELNDLKKLVYGMVGRMSRLENLLRSAAFG